MATSTITLGVSRSRRVSGPGGFGRTPAGRLASASLAIEGQRRIAGKLAGKKLWVIPTRQGMLALQREALYHAKVRSPLKTGETKGNIGTSTDKRNDPPRWADVILKPATDPKGWRYSHALDAARKRAPKGMSGKGPWARDRANPATKQLVQARDGMQMVLVKRPKRIRITKANAPYKYRGTGRKGKPLLNWFHGASQLTKRALKQEVEKIATGIRTGWGLMH